MLHSSSIWFGVNVCRTVGETRSLHESLDIQILDNFLERGFKKSNKRDEIIRNNTQIICSVASPHRRIEQSATFPCSSLAVLQSTVDNVMANRRYPVKVMCIQIQVKNKNLSDLRNHLNVNSVCSTHSSNSKNKINYLHHSGYAAITIVMWLKNTGVPYKADMNHPCFSRSTAQSL